MTTWQQTQLSPVLDELIRLIRHEIQQARRPANEVILDDVDLRKFLNVSKRTTAYWREKGIITFSKLGGKILYRLSDILKLFQENEVPSVNKNIKIGV